MKANLMTVQGTAVSRDIDIADSPIGILRKLYEEDATVASQFFSNQTAIEQLMNGQVDEAKSTFSLMDLDNNDLKVDWKVPLCNQPTIKEELARIEAEGQVPEFTICVSSIVANNNH